MAKSALRAKFTGETWEKRMEKSILTSEEKDRLFLKGDPEITKKKKKKRQNDISNISRWRKLENVIFRNGIAYKIYNILKRSKSVYLTIMKLGFSSFLKEDREKIFMIFHFKKRRGNINSSLYICHIYHQFVNIYISIKENSNFYGSLILLFLFFLITLMKFIRYEDKIGTETRTRNV